VQKTKNNLTYDLIVVPGLKLGPNWELRKDLRERLNEAAKFYYQSPGVHIAVGGKWSIWYDWQGVKPPVTEGAKMKTYLLKLGVKATDIITESRSKDSPGSVYYLKRYLRDKPKYSRLLVICAAQHEPRLKFLFYKFFGEEYSIRYLAIKAPDFNNNVTGDEEICLADQKLLLANVRPGYEDDFKHKFYKCTYYTRQASRVRASALVK
jgi:uncharacterized SAM-binding protein YcdF (DUF218 family)